MEYYVGIDLGTSSVKMLLVDGEGNIKNTVSKEYPVFYPQSGWSEQNPSDWWDAICEILPLLLDGYDARSVKGIGVAGQMHGLVVLLGLHKDRRFCFCRSFQVRRALRLFRIGYIGFDRF